jgi:hypothetical protein
LNSWRSAELTWKSLFGAMSAVLVVRQGAAEEELFVPQGALVEGLYSLLADTDWCHASKFTITEQLMETAQLVLDGNEFEWPALLEMEGTALSTIMDGTESRVFVLAAPPQLQVVEEQLPVVDALDEPLESLPVAVAGVTLLQIKELLGSAYNGDLDSTLIQVRGSSGSSMFSFKLSAMEPGMELMASVTLSSPVQSAGHAASAHAQHSFRAASEARHGCDAKGPPGPSCRCGDGVRHSDEGQGAVGDGACAERG